MTKKLDGPLAGMKAAMAEIGRTGDRVCPDDAQLLQVLGFYTERSSYNVLRLAAWKAGDGDALAAYRKGRPLPKPTRDVLDTMLRDYMRSEREAAMYCERSASGMAWLSLDFLALAAVLFLFIA